MRPSLVIMAAGLGSRYGGDKQVDGVGPNNEILMDYGICDAVKAGFRKVIFIIKPDIEGLIKRLCGSKLEALITPEGGRVEVHYVYQTDDKLPAFYTKPENRTKPFGTVHAVLCAEDVIHEPFVVVNADDFYGAEAYQRSFDYVSRMSGEGKAMMVAYYLKNTVSLYGSVTRGVCHRDGDRLTEVVETYKIQLLPDGRILDRASGDAELDPEALVSMNFWGYTPEIFTLMHEYFDDFLRSIPEGDIKAECLLPVFMDAEIKRGKLDVRVLDTDAVWFGMTYKEDLKIVREELLKLIKMGVYPENLHE